MIGILVNWVVPIIVGAVIGYVTNDIAIKMLFRPLAEKRIFGIRVPFTPGILPKNRHKLAVSLGNTVARELLNEDVLRQRFRSEDFRKSISDQVEAFFSVVLDAKLGALRFEPGSRTYDRLEIFLEGLLGNLSLSAGFERGLKKILEGILSGIGSIKLETLLSGRESLDLSRSIVEFLSSEGSRSSMSQKIAGALDDWTAGGKPIGEIIPADLGLLAERLIKALYPETFRILLEFLKTEDMRRELAENGRVIVTDILQRLNGMQRFLVAVAKYDKSIMADMDKTIAELLSSLERVGSKDETKELLARQVGGALNEWASLTPAELGKRVPDYREKLLDAVDRMMLAAAEEKGRERIALALAGAIDGNRGKTLKELARAAVGLKQEKVAQIISDALGAFLSRERGSSSLAAGIADFISSFLAGHGEESLSQLLSLSPVLRSDILALASSKAVDLIESKTNEILKTVKIKEIVIEKIDSLDMLDVEKIVLDVMKEQFTWINVFGAILGGVIGLVQALIAALL
jgi:uncharacterized membrane protein YheB (UPF0754 family)